MCLQHLSIRRVPRDRVGQRPIVTGRDDAPRFTIGYRFDESTLTRHDGWAAARCGLKRSQAEGLDEFGRWGDG